MTTPTTSDLCRLVVIAPTGSAELALPANVPLATLLPALVSLVGAAPDDPPDTPMALQRLGEEPLDEECTAAQLGLRDGDSLYLRPRQTPMPAVTYDDVIDGVAARLRMRAGRWSAATTRRMLLGLAAAVLVPGLA